MIIITLQQNDILVMCCEVLKVTSSCVMYTNSAEIILKKKNGKSFHNRVIISTFYILILHLIFSLWSLDAVCAIRVLLLDLTGELAYTSHGRISSFWFSITEFLETPPNVMVNK